ncbi:oligoendopeptidase F [Mycoplasma sp. NEAQ87857]|uniref:oligoendopeptidase F n=1 Tax=Mycoplasma sp. NEAQ87857 TaxID=2683967 RepID=UPI001E38DE8C|nr:oligoendopeptidase F [Mycoplasma sp. NEAQ87857]
MAKQYAKYSDVPAKYRWDLEDILKNKTLDQLVAEYKAIKEQRIANKDSKYQDIESYIADIKLQEQETMLSYKISNYLSNKLNTNLIDTEFRTKEQEIDFLSQQLSEQFGSETNRFFANIEKMKQWKDDPRLKDYKRDIEDLILEYEHKLDDSVEEFIVKSSFFEPDPHAIFSIITNSELDYGTVVSSKGKKIKLNPANRSELLKSDDKQIRKGAYTNYWNAYYKHKDSLASTLHQHFKAIVGSAKMRKYNSAVEMLTKSDRMTDELLMNLFTQVKTHSKKLKKYASLTKKFYKAKFNSKMEKWDTARELVQVKSTYTVEEAQEIVKKALEPFGTEYMSQINLAFSENWIDYMNVKNKRSGAYSIGGTFGIDKKYILMNFDEELRSVETLAHELGHSMHSYFSDTRNSLNNSQYPIFLAEIASIFNELMLFDYLLKTSDNDKLKFKILDSMISGFIGTVLRQVEWANYEYLLYDGIAKGNIAPDYQTISKLYYQNSLDYSLSNKTKKYKDKDNIASVYVPHYYYGFYVYKYAIGQLVALYFFSQYKKEGPSALENYINNFLSAGGSDYPINILKKVGVDLMDDNFYTQGFDYVVELIKDWEKLGKKLFIKK